MELSTSPLYFYGTSAGGQTLDQGEGGGNPFASALVELLARRNLTLKSLANDLVDLTERKSKRFQRPEVPNLDSLETLRIRPKPKAESRVALVLVFADYTESGGATSLPGAANDAKRVAKALSLAGFNTQTTVDAKRDHTNEILEEFANRSAAADVALLYTTGHGVEVGTTIHILPGDYPVSEGPSGLTELALQLQDFSVAMNAKRANLIFYAGCRDDPFAGRS